MCKEKLGGIIHKPEQQEAIELLSIEKDVVALLPTGSGKSFIYQSFFFFLKKSSIVIQVRLDYTTIMIPFCKLGRTINQMGE